MSARGNLLNGDRGAIAFSDDRSMLNPPHAN